jgi:hypothetical protein
MLTLPAELFPLMVEFAPLFSKPVWVHANVLVVSAILAPGKRTGTACLRVMGLSQERGVVNALIGVQGLLLSPTSSIVAHF